MFSRVVKRFTHNPSFYYSMSIAATWAGCGVTDGRYQMAQDYGIILFLLWALGNTPHVSCLSPFTRDTKAEGSVPQQAHAFPDRDTVRIPGMD